jgi:hypothetical protein
MVALEHQMEEAFVQWLLEVRGHAEATVALRRFHTMVNDQRKALQPRLEAIGGSNHSFADSIISSSVVPASMPRERSSHAVSADLHTIYAAFNHAAFGYAMLHTTAHRFYDLTTADLAEEHRRCYAEASQAIHQLIPDVVISEMGTEGECRCTCPSCSLGICVCWHAHVESLMPTSHVEEGGILVRHPKASSAALEADLRQGDVILGVGDQQVQTYQELQVEIRKREPGEKVRLRVKRGPGETLEVTVTRPR